MASQDWFDKDFYKILGVGKDVTEAELKKVYRKLARQYHPDSNPGDTAAEARFKEISEAYTVLGDAAQRKEYDAVRAMGGGARFTGAGPGAGSAGFEDVFANLFGGSRGGFQGGGFPGGGFPGGFGGFGGPTPGADLTAAVTVDFIDGVKGVTRKIAGQSGEDVSFRIPAGLKDGNKIRVRGRGQPSMNGGPNGDLIITVKIKPHPVFTRDGENLRVTVPVTFTEATLGATIQVPTLGGEPVKLKVAPGTANGQVLRVKGKGVVTDKTTGDLLATLQVAVPAHLSAKAKAALEAFAAELPEEDPRAELLLKAGLL